MAIITDIPAKTQGIVKTLLVDYDIFLWRRSTTTPSMKRQGVIDG
jgi:hypothetical protein